MTFAVPFAELKCLHPYSFEQFDFMDMSGGRLEENPDTISKQTQSTPALGMGTAGSCVMSSSEDTDMNTNCVKHINRNDVQLDNKTVQEVLDDKDEVIKRLEDQRKTLIAEEVKLKMELSTLKESSRELTKKMASLSSSDPRFENTNDETSPSKIGKLSDSIFNDDWYKAYESLDKDGFDEREILKRLSGIVEMCFKQCTDRSTSAMRQFLLLSETDDLPSYSKIVQVYKLRKSVCHEKSRRQTVIDEISASIIEALENQHDNKESVSTSQQHEQLNHFVSRCTELCWLALTSSPPLTIVHAVNDKDHKDIQTQFTKYAAGDHVYCDTEESLGKVAVVVWPALVSSEDYGVYNKGMVLVYDQIQSDV